MKAIELKQNIIFNLLLQSINNITAELIKKDVNVIELFNNTLTVLNNEFVSFENSYNLTPKEAKQQIKMLDNLFNSLNGLFKILYRLLEENEINIIDENYNLLIKNFNNLRDDLDIIADKKMWERMQSYKSGNFKKEDYFVLDLATL